MAESKILLLLQGNAASAIEAVDRVNEKIKEMGGEAEEHGSKLNSLFGGLIAGAAASAGAAMTGAIVEGVKAADDENVAMAKLQTAMQATSQQFSPELQEQLEQTKQHMDSLGFSGAQTTDALANMVQAGIPLQEAMQNAGTAADYARAKNMDLGSAMQQLQLASEGNMRALKTLGITQGPIVANAQKMQSAQDAVAKAQQRLNDLQASGTATPKQLAAAQQQLTDAQDKLNRATQESGNQQQNFQQIMDEVKGHVSGQADAYSKTLPGALGALKSSFEDNVLVPIGQQVIPKLNELTAWVAAHEGQIKDGFGTAMKVVGTAASVLGTVLGFVVDHLNVLGPIFLAIVGPLLVFKTALFIEKKVTDTYKLAKDGIESIGKAASGAKTVVTKGLDFAESAAKAVADFAKMAAAAVANAARAAAAWIASAAQSTAAWVAEKASFLAGLAAKAAAWVAQQAVIVASAVATTAPVIAAWAAEKVAFLAGQAIKLAVWLATNAVFVATAIASGIAAAAAFMLPLLPFILIGAAVVALVVLIVTHFQQIKDFITKAIGFVIDWVKQHWPLLLALLTGPIGLAILFIVNHFQQIKDFIAGVFNKIKEIVGDAVGAVMNIWHDFAAGLEAVWNGIKSVAESVWNGIIGVIKGVINGIISGINAFIGLIDAIQIHIPSIGVGPLSTPAFDWNGLGIPKIPSLASGSGWLNSPMLALIGDNPRGERVQTRDQFEQEMGALSGSGQTNHITINNPHSNVDVIAAMEAERRMNQLAARGILPGNRAPMAAPA